jgi:hypothetical protein
VLAATNILIRKALQSSLLEALMGGTACHSHSVSERKARESVELLIAFVLLGGIGTNTFAQNGASGALTVNVTGLPAGVPAQISLIGPGGFRRTMTGATTLTNLAPGSYAIAIAIVSSTAPNNVVYLPNISPSGSTVQIAANQSASVAVNYTALDTTWQPIGPSAIPRSGLAAAGKLQAFAINNSNPLEMYAGGGIGPGNSGPFNEAGVYKTVDGGKTWTQSNSGLTDVAADVIWLDQANPNIVLLGTFFGGIFRSADRGEHWGPVQSCPAITSPLGSTTALLQAGGILYAGTAVGIVQSTDDGLTWCIETETDVPVRALTASGEALYAGLDDGRVVIRSNAMATWVTTKPVWSNSTIWSLSAHPTDPKTCYLTDWQFDYSATTLLVTKDGGQAWLPVDSLPGASQYVAFQPSNPQTIYVGKDGPLYKSPDGGTTWN